MQCTGEAGRSPLLLRQILRSLLCGHRLCGRQLRKGHIEDQRNHNAVDRAHKERPIQKRQRLYQTGEAGEGTAGDAGKHSAHGKGDDAAGGETGAGREILPLALAHDPVGGDQHAGQRRDQRGHEGQEALEGIQQAEGCQQRADGAGHTCGDLELALVKAKEVAEGQTAGIGVGNVGGPGGQHQCHKTDKRYAQRGEDGGNVILARHDAHKRTGQQHKESCGNNAHKGGFHHIRTALGKAAASREYLHKACHPQTGLSAEYADYDGTPHAGHQEIFGKHDWYYSDAYRTIANIAMDHLWYDKDPWQTEIANRLQRFYCEEQREHWDGVFLIDGTRLEEKALHPVAIVAVNAQASLAADGPHIKECVDRFWNTPLRTGDRRYYDNFLYLFAMLALSGNYRIYK